MSDDQRFTMSRRTILGMMGLAGAGVLLPTITACSSGSGSSGNDAPTITDIRIDALLDPVSLDPLRFNSAEAERVYRLVYNSLLRWDAKGELVPDLAAALPEVSADRLTYTIKLKSGISFHDGAPFTSKDVVFTYQQVMAAANTSTWRQALSFVDSVSASDDATVVVKLKKLYTPIEGVFALIPIISSAKPYVSNDTYAHAMNGTGAYVFDSWQQGTKIALRRNDKYKVGDVAAHATVSVYTVKEDSARIANLLNGTTHIVADVPYDQLKLLRSKSDIKVEVPDKSTIQIFMLTSQKSGVPTTNQDFRKGVALGIDRGTIVDQVLAGAGVSASTLLGSGMPYWNKDLGTKYGDKADVTAAKSALQASGVSLDKPIELVVRNTPVLAQIATIVQANLKEVGIDVKVSAEEAASYLPRLRSGDYDLLMLQTSIGGTSGYTLQFMYSIYYSNSPSNLNKWNDPEMDRLLDAAVSAPDDQAQAAWEAVQQRELDTVGIVPIVTQKYAEAHRSALRDYAASGLTYFSRLVNPS